MAQTSSQAGICGLSFDLEFRGIKILESSFECFSDAHEVSFLNTAAVPASAGGGDKLIPRTLPSRSREICLNDIADFASRQEFLATAGQI
jgi:hypothetical protein